MFNKATFALSAAVALLTSAVSASDALKPYSEQTVSPSLLLAIASPAIASAQRDAGKHTGNRMDRGSYDIDVPEGFGTEAHRSQLELTAQALLERDEALEEVAYLQRLLEVSAIAQTRVAVAPNKNFTVKELSCGFPHQCTIGLPEGVQLDDTPATLEAVISVVSRQARDRTYVVVSARPSAPEAVPVTLFTNAGPYFFEIRKDGDIPNYFVDLN